MKKIISLLIAVSMTLSFIPAAAAEGSSGEDITDTLLLKNSAVYNEEDNSILLCPAKSWSIGHAQLPFAPYGSFSIDFDFYIGDGSSADGIAFVFYADNMSDWDGGYIGVDECGGYAVEIDTFQNAWDNDNSHVALVYNKTNNHLAYEQIPTIRDNSWHTATISLDGRLLRLYIDGDCVLTHREDFDSTNRLAYFSAATGSSSDNHYIRNVRFNGDRKFNNDITINRSGKGYARFVIKDKSGRPIRNQRLKYMLSGFSDYSAIKEVTTDSDGVALIETPVLTGKNEKKILSVTFPDVETQKDVYSFTVNINDVTYTHSWEGKASAGVGIEGNLGYDGKIGVLDAKASLASLSAEGKGAKTLSLSEIYDNGKRSLRISSIQDIESAGEANFGVFAEANIGKYKAEVAPASVSGEVETGSGAEVALTIENYSPENRDHLAKIGYFLLDSSMPELGNNILLKLLARIIYGFSFNEINNSFSLKLGAGTHFGLAEFGDVLEAEVAGADVDSFYTYSFGKDKDMNKVYSSSAELTTGASLLTIKAGEEDIDNTSSTFGGEAVIDGIELGATVSDGKTDELSLSMHEMSYSDSVIWYEESKNTYKDFVFRGPSARAAATCDKRIELFTKGLYGLFSVFEIKGIAKKLLASEYEADYAKRISKTQGISADFAIGASALVGGELGFGFSCVESCDYETENGITANGISLRLSESYPEKYIEESKNSIDTILAEPIKYLRGEIDKAVVTEEKTPEEGVKNEKASISGRTRRKIGITGVCPVPKAESFSILLLSEENVSAAKTVGNPYVISLYDESGSYTDKIEDEGIILSLSFDSADLAAAGLADSEEALSPLKIYRWDNARSAYIPVGGELDFENSCVRVNITESGQYILAYDTSSPEISDLRTKPDGDKVKFTAIIRDMSGVEAAELKLDGKTVADKSSFDSLYNPSCSLFTYTHNEPLSEGEHTFELTAADSAGNCSPEPVIISFNVNRTAPVITAFNEPEITDDGRIIITAEAEGTPAAFNAGIIYENAIHSYPMTCTFGGVWTAEADDIPANTKIKVFVTAYDADGNSTESDSYDLVYFGKGNGRADIGIFEISDNKLYAAAKNNGNKLSGKIAAAGYNKDGILKEVKYRDYTFDSGYTPFDIEIDSSYDEYRLFFWDEDMIPLSYSSYKKN